MIRWSFDLVISLAYLAFALSTYSVYRVEQAVQWGVRVVYLVALVMVCAIDVALLWLWRQIRGTVR